MSLRTMFLYILQPRIPFGQKKKKKKTSDTPELILDNSMKPKEAICKRGEIQVVVLDSFVIPT